MSFVPNYYPTKGLLFEPYAQKTDTGVINRQIGGANHDYREIEFFKKVVTTGESQWVDPYYDNEGAKDTVISYVMPVHDTSGKLAGVTCIDMALDWLSDTLNYRHIYPSSFDLLLTEDGKIIAHPAERCQGTCPFDTGVWRVKIIAGMDFKNNDFRRIS